MKKLLIGALVASGFVMASLSEAQAASKTLSVPTHFQEQDMWCWNAASNSVLRFYDKHFTDQCEYAEAGRQIDPVFFGSVHCCLNPLGGSPFCNQGNWLSSSGSGTNAHMLALLGVFGVTATFNTGGLTYATVKSEVDGNHPVLMRWDWFGGGAHVLTIKGYTDAVGGAADKVSYVDPWDDGSMISDYTFVVGCNTAACGHTWTETLKTATPAAADNKATLYSSASYGGTATTVTSSVANLGANSNTASSAKVRGVPYIFFDATNYGTPAWSVVPRDYSSFTGWGETTDNQVSSVMKMPSNTERIAVVLFSGQNYTGTSVTLTADTPTMPAGWDNNVSSLIVVGKIWQLYTSSNYSGNPYAVTSYGGPNRDGFYPTPSAWGGPDNDASSARYTDATATPLLNPIMLYENTDLTGRAVLIWDGGPGINDLASIGFDNKVSSMRTYGGTWKVFTNTNQGVQNGSSLHANHWYRTNADWGGTDNAITSLDYDSAGGWRG